MAPPLLILRNIHLTFGGTPLLEGAEISVSAGARICLVGRNGSGKSTFLKIAAGLLESDSGERFLQPETTVRYLRQEPDMAGFATVMDYVAAGLAPGDDPHRAERLLDKLGLTGDEDPAVLSGGEARRAALARALAPAPDILLLDEPTNHLDLPAIEWLESELTGSRSALVLISHDRRFLENLSATTVWLHHGLTRRLDAGFEKFEPWRDGILEHDAVEQHKMDRKIVREMDWMRKGVTARRKRNQGRLRALQDLRQERRERRQTAVATEITAAKAESSGKLVIEAKGIHKAYDGAPVVRDFSARILRGDRIGIVGPNGAGKTTLLNMLTGQLAPDGGEHRMGTNLQMVSMDQRREQLDPTESLADALTGGTSDMVSVGGETRHVIGYMKDFLFLPEQVGTAVGALSGGERGRVLLARAMARPSNLLVLDEPTNDLDLETLDLLQEMLADYPGTVLLVSHDRDFLDRVVTSVIAPDDSQGGDGGWSEYAGGYTDMTAQRSLADGIVAGADGGEAGAAKSKTTGKSAGKSLGKSTRNPSGKSTAGKLSYKDQYALENLPARMADLEVQAAGFLATLDDADLFSRDPIAFEAALEGLETAQADLVAAEEQWLELEMKRETLGG